MKKLQITLCNTCVRDNREESPFADTDAVAAVYRKQLQDLASGQMPQLKQHNCFNYCEQFHCVQIDDRETAFLLRKVSDPERIRSVCEWVKTCAQSGKFELADSLKDLLIESHKLGA